MPDISEIKQKIDDHFKDAPPVRVIVVSFLLLVVLGTLLLMLPISSTQGWTDPVTALFTSTSATCVTGLAVVDTTTYWSFFGQLVILCLIQLGGLGLSTFAIAFTLLIRRKLGIREMLIAGETSGGTITDVKSLLKLMIGFTFACELLGALLLMIRFVPAYGAQGAWISIFIAVSAYCNAGFDLLSFIPGNVSLTAFSADPLVCLTIAGLIVIGGLGFVVVQDIYRCKLYTMFRGKDTLRLNFHSQVCLRMTAILLVFGTVAFFLLEFDNTMGDFGFFEKLNSAVFQSVNTRTAGFASVNIGQQHEITKILSIALMFIGACPGSTAGGIKVTTLMVLVMTVVAAMKGKSEAVFLKHRLDVRLVYKSLAITLIAFMLVLLGAGVIAGLNPHITFLDSLFETVSAFGTTGLSTGITASLDVVSKLILCITMFIGRVGPIAFGLSLTVKGKRRDDSILPEGRMLIG